MQNLHLKKFFLYLLIVSVSVSALIGIAVILFGNFGEFETKILSTTMTVTCMSILGLACGAYLENGRGKILPVGGIVFAVLSTVLWIILIWQTELQEEYLIKTVLTITLFAASCSHLSLLSIAKLDRKFLWSRYTAHLAVWSLAVILMWLIWTEIYPSSDFISRILGVSSIVVAALTIVTPIFHRLSRQTENSETEKIDAEIARLKARIEELEKQKAEVSETAVEGD